METYIKNVEFCCPKCNNPQKTEMEFEMWTLNQFNFKCQCGCNFKYQYGNVSHESEMSTYKNPYTYEILTEVQRVEKEVKERFSSPIL